MRLTRAPDTAATNGDHMMIKIPDQPEFADDGADIPKAPPGSDLEQLITLLEYCRIRDFQLMGPVRIGAIELVVVDKRQVEAGARSGPPDRGGWAEMGGYDPAGEPE